MKTTTPQLPFFIARLPVLPGWTPERIERSRRQDEASARIRRALGHVVPPQGHWHTLLTERGAYLDPKAWLASLDEMEETNTTPTPTQLVLDGDSK